MEASRSRVVVADDDVLLREGLASLLERFGLEVAGQALYVTEGTVEKHVRSIMAKLRLPESAVVHRRVLAVLAFLDAH